MRAVVQRVSRAAVTVGDDELVGSIGEGLCVLVGVTHDDDEATAGKLADKLWHLRVFDDADGVMNVSASDAGAEVLVISQFTLYGNTEKGRRPSWNAAAPGPVRRKSWDFWMTCSGVWPASRRSDRGAGNNRVERTRAKRPRHRPAPAGA